MIVDKRTRSAISVALLGAAPGLGMYDIEHSQCYTCV